MNTTETRLKKIIEETYATNASLSVNEEFGNSVDAFIMHKDAFEAYEYEGSDEMFLSLLKWGNIGEKFDIKYWVTEEGEDHPSGCFIANVKSGQVFERYVFSHMELDDNTASW